MRKILIYLLGIFLIMIIGSVLLSEFPQLQPLFEEGKDVVVSLYNISLVKYGTIATVFIIIALLVLAGDSKGR